MNLVREHKLHVLWLLCASGDTFMYASHMIMYSVHQTFPLIFSTKNANWKIRGNIFFFNWRLKSQSFYSLNFICIQSSMLRFSISVQKRLQDYNSCTTVEVLNWILLSVFFCFGLVRNNFRTKLKIKQALAERSDTY